MTPFEFGAFKEKCLEYYSRDVAKAQGVSQEVAQQRAMAQFDVLLPEGIATKENYFYVIKNEQLKAIGHFWFMIRDEGARIIGFICDIYIDDPHRGKGYGTQVLKWFESEAKRLGADRIALHAFGHNQGAIRLYQSIGMIITNVNMAKDL